MLQYFLSLPATKLHVLLSNFTSIILIFVIMLQLVYGQLYLFINLKMNRKWSLKIKVASVSKIRILKNEIYSKKLLDLL